MDAIPLEKAPKVAVYAPPNAPPWDDAVTMALDYAGIKYDKVWDAEVMGGQLKKWDWLHLHHEDFTGQYSKFYLSYAGAPWLADMVQRNTTMAHQLGFPNVPAEKRAVAQTIARYVEGGGFLFAMCAATETLDLALASEGVDIAAAYADGTPMDPDASRKMHWDRAFAFHDAHLETSPTTSVYSDIDGHQVNSGDRRQPLGSFTLFNFSAKIDRDDAGAESSRRHPRFLRPHDLVHPPHAQVERHGPRRRARRAVGQVHPRGAGAGDVDLLRRARPRGSATPDRRRADRPVAAPALTGLPSHPEQRPLPGGEEEGAQDLGAVECVSAGRRAPRSGHGTV
jgi:hypothetical protein